MSRREETPKVTAASRECIVVSYEDERSTVDYRGGLKSWGSSDTMRALRELFECGSDEELVSIEVDARGLRGLVRKDHQ